MSQEIIFTEEDYIKMEEKSKELLGWSLSSKTGMSLKEMIADPDKGIAAIKNVKQHAGFIDNIKLGKVLDLLTDPNWKEELKKALS